jgi:hypothetical protein
MIPTIDMSSISEMRAGALDLEGIRSRHPATKASKRSHCVFDFEFMAIKQFWSIEGREAEWRSVLEN